MEVNGPHNFSFEQQQLLQSLYNQLPGSDAEFAREVAAFEGDISTVKILTCCVRMGYGCFSFTDVLPAVAACLAPLTLRALAARDDIDPYRRDQASNLPAFVAAMESSNIPQFLDAFPMYDVNAPCGLAVGSLTTLPMWQPVHWQQTWLRRASWVIACVAAASK